MLKRLGTSSKGIKEREALAKTNLYRSIALGIVPTSDKPGPKDVVVDADELKKFASILARVPVATLVDELELRGWKVALTRKEG